MEAQLEMEAQQEMEAQLEMEAPPETEAQPVATHLEVTHLVATKLEETVEFPVLNIRPLLLAHEKAYNQSETLIGVSLILTLSLTIQHLKPFQPSVILLALRKI